MEVKNIQKYVTEKLMNPDEKIGIYKKYARVQARLGVAGEKIATILRDGHAEVDPEHPEVVSEGDWVVTNPSGEQYKVSGAKFAKRYDVEAGMGADGKYAPKGPAITALQIHEDITIYVPWGENGALVPQHLRAGSYLNITDVNDIYGIAEQEFYETYAPCDEKGIFRDPKLREAFEQAEFAPEDSKEDL